jgi:glycosyltransferase involved in cell wall biosynthesis
MKKITFFGADFPPTGGGIATYCYEWILKTSENARIKKVKAIIIGNKLTRNEKISDKLEVQTFSQKGFFLSAVLVPFFMLKNIRSSLFHSLNLFPIGFWVVFWSKILLRKSAVTFYGTDACTNEGRPITKKLKKWTIENATHSITISNFTREETKKTLGITRDIRVIYPPLPLKTLGAQTLSSNIDQRINDDDFIILSVGRMVTRKGLELLIEAISMIPDHKV